MDFQLPEYNLFHMLPEIGLFIAACLVITVDVMTKRKSANLVGYLAMAGVGVAGLLLAITFTNAGVGKGFGSMFYNTPMSYFFKVIFLGAAFMAIGSSIGTLTEKVKHHRGEFFGLMMLSTVGMMFLASASELLALYIGLELTTIPLFVLASFFKDDKRSVESGVKFLIVGAFSSGLLLYGLSFLYGATGTSDILHMKYVLAATFAAREGLGLILVLATFSILAGVGFKLALPPFHQWAPDVYEGAPTPVTAFLSVGSKAAGLVAFAQLMVNGLYAFYEPSIIPSNWGVMVGVMAGAAMVIGNVTAIKQTNIKRMLAYSSIAHAGYVMVGMLALNELGLAAVGFYMFAYMFANMGAFAIVAIVEHRTGSCELSSYQGLGSSSPFLAISMTIFLLSLTGIPPLAGFFGKYYVFAAAIKLAGSMEVHQWMYWLVGVGLLTSVIALYYYANVMKQMYFAKADGKPLVGLVPAATAIVILGLAGVVLFGLFPEPILRFASDIPFSHGFTLP